MNLTFEQFLGIRMGLTPSDAANLVSLRDFLRNRENDLGFWLGLQAWGAHQARQKLKLATKGTEPERWIAFGRHEESCNLMDTLRELERELERAERAYNPEPEPKKEW